MGSLMQDVCQTSLDGKISAVYNGSARCENVFRACGFKLGMPIMSVAETILGSVQPPSARKMKE